MENCRCRAKWRFCSFVPCAIFAFVVCQFGTASSLTICQAQENGTLKQQKSAEELRLEHARLNVQLAETELKLAIQANQELEESIPSSITGAERQKILNMKRISKASIERLKSNVAISKSQLSMAESPSTGNAEKLRIRYAEEKIKLAKINLDLIKAEKLQGKGIPDLQIIREDLKYRLALIHLELLGNPENLLTIVDSLQRQVDQLREDMIAQDQRLSAVEDQGAIIDQ